MALPPSGYPQIRGQACGADWTNPTTITGLLPNTGFGNQFSHVIEPITNNYPLILNIGDDRDEQELYTAKILDKIREIREAISSHLIGDPLRPTKGQKTSLEWLLDHAEAEIEAADQIWDRWYGRDGGAWPLSQGDHVSDFLGGICTQNRQMGKWVDPPGRGGPYLCPGMSERARRQEDRKAIGERFNHALAHVYCAEFGYWRLRLYKEAAEAYKKLPSYGVGGLITPPTTKVTPGFQVGGMGLAGEPAVDPCKDLGIGCPPGEGPEGCPTNFCVDLDLLPDPGEVPEVDGFEGEGAETPVEPGRVPLMVAGKPVRAPQLIAAGAGLLVLTGITYTLLGR